MADLGALKAGTAAMEGMLQLIISPSLPLPSLEVEVMVGRRMVLEVTVGLPQLIVALEP